MCGYLGMYYSTSSGAVKGHRREQCASKIIRLEKHFEKITNLSTSTVGVVRVFVVTKQRNFTLH